MEEAFTLRSAASSPHRITAGQIDDSQTERDPGYRSQNMTVIALRLDSIYHSRTANWRGRRTRELYVYIRDY